MTILHTNDLHAHDQSFQDRGKLVGGMARLGHLIRQLRKEQKNVVVADAGDIFQGTPFFTYYLGEVEVAMLNMIGYDFYTIGNHEFDAGAINLAKQLEKAKFDILNCNLNADALPQLKKLLKPSVIKTIDGQKVAFVGAITPDIETLSLSRDGVVLQRDSSEKSKNLNWLGPIREEVERVANQGVDKIILVTHCGLEVDKILAREIPQVDAIIGGHSHTRLDTPVVVEHQDGSQTMIVQTGSYGRNLGKLDLCFDKQGCINSKDTHYKLFHITDEIAEDKDIRDYLALKGQPLQTLKDTVLSYASHDFDNNFRAMKTDSALGDLICDSFYEAGISDNAEITLENRGGIRSRIEKGAINLEKIEELLPFDNHLVFADVSGERLKKTLEHSVAGATGGKFLDVHGLKFAYDSERKSGDRIVFALAEKNKIWQELQPQSTYRIGMTDYSFKGGEGYQFPDAKNIKYTDLKLNEYLKNYLVKHPKIKPHYGDRIAYLSGSLLQAVGKNQFTDSPLANCSSIKVSAFTANEKGVTTVFKDTTGSSSVLPLTNPELIVESVPLKEFAKRIARQKAQLKRYITIVAEGQSMGKRSSQESSRNSQQSNKSSKFVKAVSYPVSIDELKENFAGLN
ncbi:5'-nucleotidase C-terminal domain-containing protein [bacterium]|nr:5'-nucleotidase C-terminal domain-containing protein [bacterium]MBP9810150.1 5'-nucleotidase C-terminal domain-containing protein [bacterium]